MVQKLNEKQVDLLRFLQRQTTPVRSADLDGRVVRALKSRSCIEERNGVVRLTENGRALLHEGPPPRRRARRVSAERGAVQARSQTILRALEMLENALPAEAEVAVGSMFAYADDVVAGFRAYARDLVRKKA